MWFDYENGMFWVVVKFSVRGKYECFEIEDGVGDKKLDSEG